MALFNDGATSGAGRRQATAPCPARVNRYHTGCAFHWAAAAGCKLIKIKAFGIPVGTH